jgi:hypothetical protein
MNSFAMISCGTCAPGAPSGSVTGSASREGCREAAPTASSARGCSEGAEGEGAEGEGEGAEGEGEGAEGEGEGAEGEGEGAEGEGEGAEGEGAEGGSLSRACRRS